MGVGSWRGGWEGGGDVKKKKKNHIALVYWYAIIYMLEHLVTCWLEM